MQPPLLGPHFEPVLPRRRELQVAWSEPGSFSNFSCPVPTRREHPV